MPGLGEPLGAWRSLALPMVVALSGLVGCGDGAEGADGLTEAVGASEPGACLGGFDSGLEEPVGTFEDLESGRYCEVLVVYPHPDGGMEADVYNSLGLGSCPQALWEGLDAASIKEGYPGALLVMLNGPRYFLMQHVMANTTMADTTQVYQFGDIPMLKVATVVADASAQQGYVPAVVARDNVWRFAAGARVHELIDGDGNVYIMQSFARIVDQDLAYEDLETLGERLELPEGWAYRARVLDEDLDVRADGTATMVQDELKNTYQWRSDCQVAP